MFLVGLTGGIGSGKSTVAAMFKQLNCPVIDADQIAREVVEPGKPAWSSIREKFGAEVFNDDGTLNRDKLGEIVFADSTKRRQLNSIIHPFIYRAIVVKLFTVFCTGSQFVVLDLPLLFESGKMVPFMSTTICVYCDRATQIERLFKTRGLTKEAALQRIDAQMPLAKKRNLATYVIDNEGSLEELKQHVHTLHDILRRSKAHWKLRIAAMLFIALIVFVAYLLFRICMQ